MGLWGLFRIHSQVCSLLRLDRRSRQPAFRSVRGTSCVEALYKYISITFCCPIKRKKLVGVWQYEGNGRKIFQGCWLQILKMLIFVLGNDWVIFSFSKMSWWLSINSPVLVDCIWLFSDANNQMVISIAGQGFYLENADISFFLTFSPSRMLLIFVNLERYHLYLWEKCRRRRRNRLSIDWSEW